MSYPPERDYLDARFDGLEKLVTAKFENLNEYVGAVSRNVKEVRAELQEHKESADAHGLGSSRNNASSIVGWLALGLSAVMGAVEFMRGKHG